MTIDPRRAATVDFDHVSKYVREPKNKKEAAKLKDQPGAVNDLSLDDPGRQDLVLVGPSGCGKTTSLKMVNRLIEPTGGPDPARRRGRREARRDRAPPRDRLRHPVDRPVPAPDDHGERRRPFRACWAGPRHAGTSASEELWPRRARPGRVCATAIRPSSRAASASASASPAPSPRTRRSCSWTSRSAPSTRSCASGSRTSSCDFRRSSPRRSCS